MYGNLQDGGADLVSEIIVRKLQAYDLIMQAGQKVAEALELHALFAIFTEEVQVQASVTVPVYQHQLISCMRFVPSSPKKYRYRPL